MQLLFTVSEEALVVAAPYSEVAAIELGNTVGHVLQKTSIVRDQDKRAPKIAQLLFQPVNRWYIEVVSGFVQQQDVRIAHQRLAKSHPATPATRELTHGRIRG